MTLTEITIVSVILVMMAGLAIPSYFKTVEESRSSEAKANLSTLHFAQKIFRESNSAKKFYPVGGGTKTTTSDLTEITTQLNVDISPNFYNIEIETAGGGSTSAYTATATRSNDSTRRYRVNESGVVIKL